MPESWMTAAAPSHGDIGLDFAVYFTVYATV
jgi:hypothetical protein